MKNRFAALLIATAMMASILPIGAVAVETAQPSAYSSLATFSESLTSYDTLQTAIDFQGNTFGPADYAVSENKTYILNTAVNCVYECQNNGVTKEIDLDALGVFGNRLCVEEDNIYILTNYLEVGKIMEDELIDLGSIDPFLTSDTVFQFEVKGQNLYISEPTPNGNITHLFICNPGTGKLEKIKTFAGYMVDETTFYQSEVVREEDRIFGHSCNISILDQDGREIDFLTLHSDNYIVGAQYFGKNSVGNHIVKQIEMAQDGTFEETIRTIDENGEVVTCALAATAADSMLTPIKLSDGVLCQFEMEHNTGAIQSIATESLPTAADFTSALNPINTAFTSVASPPTTVAASNTISRDTVIDIAEDYCYSFYWTCTSSNLQPLEGWECPRYVTGAGTYSSMPYCWGGFDTVSSFTSGLSQGGRVGNIDTETSDVKVPKTYGLDCSGYVSRCWGLSTHYATSAFNLISTALQNPSLLQPGDALNRPNVHIVLFYDTDSSGNYLLYESTKYNSYDRVAYTMRTASSMSLYTPIRYNKITD